MVGSRGAGPLLCAVTRGLDWRRKVLLLLLVFVSWGCVEEGSWVADDDELVPLVLLLLAETRAARIALTASSRGAHSASTLSWAS